MDIELTRDADKLICAIYAQFLRRRDNGSPKRKAGSFSNSAELVFLKKVFTPYIKSDVDDALMELGRAKIIRLYLGGTFSLEDPGIIYMENRFKNGFKEIIDHLSSVFGIFNLFG